MKNAARQKVEACEEMVRRGELSAVRKQLFALRKEKIHRDDLANVAELSRRVGLHEVGLKILRPVITPSSRRHASPTPKEKAVYAALLIKVGAFEEAIGYLEQPTPEVPESLLYRGYAHVAQWDYPEAIPYLLNYSQLDSITPYQRITAQVNLAAALVFTEKLHHAEPLLEEILRTTRENGWHLLLGGALEISARLAMGREDWSGSLARLAEAERELKENSNVQLYARKWRALLPLLKGDPSDADLARVASVRDEALHARHWETIRDCDHYMALALKDQELFSRVFYGTPFPRFRERMLKNRSGLIAPPHYHWQCGGAGGRVFDVERGLEVDGSAALKPGQKLHLFTKALVQDFYRPTLLGTIHAKVFPGVHFDPVHSSRRISDLIRRLRQWLAENDVPLEVEVHDGAFRVNAKGPIRLYLENPDLRKDPGSVALDVQLKSLRELWPDGFFSTQEAADKLCVSRRAANLLLARATEEGKLVRLGQGPSTRYRFPEEEAE